MPPKKKGKPSKQDGGDKIGGQEGRVQRNQVDEEEGQHQMLEHFLKAITNNPVMYSAPRTKYLRDFVSLVERNPDTFRSVDGDDTVTMPVPPQERTDKLTQGYVTALSELRDTSSITDRPVLSVVSVDPKFNADAAGNFHPSQNQNVRITELRLVDGDDCQIHARLAVHLAEMGRLLQEGDIIRLDRFTELRYRVNEESPRMPALFIHQFSRVGGMEIPPAVQGNDNLLACTKALPSEHADMPTPLSSRIIDPRTDPKPICSDENRICAVYGVRFFGCICDCLPVRQRNLATIQQDCYFATDELNEMPNNHKRNMLFWWYATNAYGISGKGNINKMPECLEYDIRAQYPNPDGVPHTGCRQKSSD